MISFLIDFKDLPTITVDGEPPKDAEQAIKAMLAARFYRGKGSLLYEDPTEKEAATEKEEKSASSEEETYLSEAPPRETKRQRINKPRATALSNTLTPAGHERECYEAPKKISPTKRKFILFLSSIDGKNIPEEIIQTAMDVIGASSESDARDVLHSASLTNCFNELDREEVLPIHSDREVELIWEGEVF